MIEVIKHGKTKFTATCANCGCEFTYEVEDVKSGGVGCPDCGYYVKHTAMITDSIRIHYPPDCRDIKYIEYPPKTKYPPKTMYFSTTDANKANTAGTILGDVYTTEKDLETQQMFKDQMSKKPFIPCTDKE